MWWRHDAILLSVFLLFGVGVYGRQIFLIGRVSLFEVRGQRSGLGVAFSMMSSLYSCSLDKEEM